MEGPEYDLHDPIPAITLGNDSVKTRRSNHKKSKLHKVRPKTLVDESTAKGHWK